MPFKKQIPTLSVLAKSKVSDLLVFMLSSNNDYTKEVVEDLCTILSNLGLLPSLVEPVLDSICHSGAPAHSWDRALFSVLNFKTTSFKIKSGWQVGDSMLGSLRRMSRLVYLDITGVGSDPILTALGQCCPHLQCLKASYSSQITDLGLRALCGMSKLATEEFTIQHQSSPKNKRMVKTELDSLHTDEQVLEFLPKITAPMVDRDMEARGALGCYGLTMLQIMGCHNLTVKSVIDLLLNLSHLSYLGYDKIGEVFKSSSIFEANRTYRVQNFEQTVSHMENMDGHINHVVAHQDFLEKLADICPKLKTVKLNINKDNDDYVKHLIKIKELEEVIIDYPGTMGPGFRSFLTSSGSRLTQLGLTLREFKMEDIQLISHECENLRILHLFFANFLANSSILNVDLKLLNLEGLYLGVSRSCNLSVVHQHLTFKLLTTSPMLRTLYLSGVAPCFDDQFLTYLLDRGCLKLLENIHVKEEANLTKVSLGTLLSHCSNLRKVNMSTWNITEEEFLQVVKKTEDENIELVLIGPK